MNELDQMQELVRTSNAINIKNNDMVKAFERMESELKLLEEKDNSIFVTLTFEDGFNHALKLFRATFNSVTKPYIK